MTLAGPDRPRVGIVILNWNGWRDTIQAVTSTRALTYPDFHVYVVDNASSDGSEAELRAWDPTLTLIQSGGNLGWSGGNNVGIRAARQDGCRHVLLLNNDATIRPDALEPLVEAARDPRVGAAGSLIVADRDPGWVEFGGTYIEERTGHPRQRHGRLAEMTLPADPVPMAAVKGCSILLTDAGLNAVGLLDEVYFLNYDETDWCYRVTAAGLLNVLVCRSVVEHKGAVSFDGTEGPLYRYFVTRNRLVFARRHLDRTGRIAAWRTAFWEFRQALFADRGWTQRRCLMIASLRAVADYWAGRLGDCPDSIRVLNRRFRDA